ncbi:MAG TPA: flippase [Nitrospiria bacterium]|nr:flippase [Nitrospiria bacterium]
MKTEKLIIKNTFYLTAGKGLGDLLTFLFLIYFARIFGTDILGKYGFAMSLCGLLTVFVSLGLNSYMVRDISQDKTRNAKYVGNLLTTQVVLAVLIWILILSIAFALNLPTDTRIILVLMGGFHVFLKLSTHFGSVFRAHEDMHYTALLEIFHKILILGLGISSILLWKNPVITLAAYPISSFARFALGFFICVKKYGWPDLKFDYGFIKDSLIQANPFFIGALLEQFYDRIGLIILTFFNGESAAGVYWAADRLLAALSAGLGIFGAATFPVMARLSAESKEALFKLSERSIRFMLIAVLPFATLLYVAARPIMLLLYGNRFVESILILKIISWRLVFIGINLVLSSLLLVTFHQREWVKIKLLVYVGYGIFCLILIPRYSYVGLAYAKLFAEILLVLVAYAYARKTVHDIPMFKMANGSVLACLLAILVSYLMANIAWWLTVPVVVMVCVSGLFLFKGIALHDLVFFKNIMMTNTAAVVDEQDDSGYLRKPVP